VQVLRDSNRALKARLTVSSDNTSAGTAGIAYDVGTPATSGFAQTSQQSHQATRALTNIFIRRTVGEKFVSEIRGANVRHDADVGSARQLHAELPKPWLNVTRRGNFTIAHNGELSAPIEAEVTMPSVAPVDVPVVSRDNNALHFPTPDATRELVRSQILDTIFEVRLMLVVMTLCYQVPCKRLIARCLRSSRLSILVLRTDSNRRLEFESHTSRCVFVFLILQIFRLQGRVLSYLDR